MQSLEFEGWRIAFDPEATRRATAGLRHGAAEACGCEACRSFARQRAELLGQELLELLALLGTDPSREWSVEPLGRGPQGDCEVIATWRFVGQVLGESDRSAGVAFRDDPQAPGHLALVELAAAYPFPDPSVRE